MLLFYFSIVSSTYLRLYIYFPFIFTLSFISFFYCIIYKCGISTVDMIKRIDCKLPGNCIFKDALKIASQQCKNGFNSAFHHEYAKGNTFVNTFAVLFFKYSCIVYINWCIQIWGNIYILFCYQISLYTPE